MRNFNTTNKTGIVLIELLVAVIIISIIALILVARYGDVVNDARQQTCQCNKSNIDAQVQLYYIKEGEWPSTNLIDIASNTNYFPDGLPTCPVSYVNYALNPSSHRVTGHILNVTTHP